MTTLIDCKYPIEYLKEFYIGKTVRMCTSDKEIKMSYRVEVKKSGSVMDEQFNNGNRKFRMTSDRTKNIGRHRVFESHKIVDLYIKYLGDYYNNTSLIAKLDNDVEIDLLNLS